MAVANQNGNLALVPYSKYSFEGKMCVLKFVTSMINSKTLACSLRNNKSVFVVSLDSAAKSVQIPVCGDVLGHNRCFLLLSSLKTVAKPSGYPPILLFRPLNPKMGRTFTRTISILIPTYLSTMKNVTHLGRKSAASPPQLQAIFDSTLLQGFLSSRLTCTPTVI